MALLVSTPVEYGWARREYPQFAGFGAVATFLPPLIFLREKDLRIFFHALVFTAVIVALTTLVLPPSPSTYRTVFLSGVDSISHARLFAVGIICTLSLWPTDETQKWSVKRVVMLAGIAGILFYAMVMSGSRGPVLHLLVCLAVALLAQPIPAWWKLLLIAVIAATSYLVVELMPDTPILSRFSRLAESDKIADVDYSISYRLSVWTFILETWNEAFFFGHGLGVPEVLKNVQPHSVMLDILYSGGFVSFLLFSSLWIVALVTWARRPGHGQGARVWLSSYPAFLLSCFGIVTATTGYESAGARYVILLFTLAVVASNIRRTTQLAGHVVGNEDSRKWHSSAGYAMIRDSRHGS